MIKFLFKGKTKDGLWAEGSYLRTTPCVGVRGRHDHWIVRSATQNGGWVTLQKKYAVDPMSVSQYIGLEDKNGREVFENDILEFDDEIWTESCSENGWDFDSCKGKNRAVVRFDESESRFDFFEYQYRESQVEADLHENHALSFSEIIGKSEVVGNFFDDPGKVEEI